MNYKEFVEKVCNDLKDVLPDELSGATIMPRHVDKLQGESYDGIVIEPENCEVDICMDLRKAYERVNDGRTYNVVLARIGFAAIEGYLKRPRITAGELEDYGTIKGRLMIQAVPTNGNEEMLAEIPHMEKEDISIVFRLIVDKQERGQKTALINYKMLEKYGISEEKLHEDAMFYARKNFPASIRDMSEVIAELVGIDVELLGMKAGKMYVATCNGGVHGAGCIFYPEFMKQAAAKLGGSFFVLPSSVHEVVLIPDDKELKQQEMKRIVQEVNATEVEPADRLSDSVYYYDAVKHEFKKV